MVAFLLALLATVGFLRIVLVVLAAVAIDRVIQGLRDRRRTEVALAEEPREAFATVPER